MVVFGREKGWIKLVAGFQLWEKEIGEGGQGNHFQIGCLLFGRLERPFIGFVFAWAESELGHISPNAGELSTELLLLLSVWLSPKIGISLLRRV